ncbi:MAG: TadE/TadG family type IV pilus assembly protein [Mycobacteriales bacterium]
MEFALVSPLLIILVFGIIQFGIVFAQQLSLSNGARQGSRVGVVNKTTCGAIVSEVQESASTIGMDSTAVSVLVQLKDGATTTTPCGSAYTTATTGTGQPCLGSGTTARLVVTAKFTSSLVIPLVTSIGNLDLNGKGVYRCEYTD